MAGNLERSARPSDEPTNRHLEEKLRLEREKLAFVLRAAGVAAWEWDPGTDQVTTFTMDAETVLRLPKGKTIRRAEDFYRRIHRDDQARVLSAIGRTLRGEGDYREEFRIVGGDDSIMWCMDQAHWIEDEPGSPRLHGVLVDITERKQREEQVRALNNELSRRAEELQVVLDVLPVGVFLAEDASCSAIRANPAGAALLGLQPGTNASKTGPEKDQLPFRVMRDGREIPPDELPMQRAARTGVAVRGAEVEIIRDDGTASELLMDAIPLFDERRQVRGCLGASIDITERKRAEVVRNEEARRKDEFLATLAHELRNPLAPIRMALELLRRRGAVAPDQEQALGVIGRQVDQLTRLVDDLLDVSRITRGKFELRKEWVELDAIVDRALETSRPALEASGHQPNVRREAGSLRIRGDLTRLSQAVSNLLHNAAKNTPPDRNIWISTARRDGDVQISVRDEGAGIAPEVMPRIFDLFAQADTSLEKAQGGLGIGLTITKQLVEMHGGRIFGSSEGLGRGSEFTLRLPAEALRDDRAASSGWTEPAAATARRRVLVVDDNRDAADTLAMVLELTNHEVRTAYGARGALEASRPFRPEVVFLDIGMPEMSGFEVARRLREQAETRDSLIVAITGWGQEADRQRAKAAGFDHHLVKPVTPEAVAQVLAQDQ